MTRKARSKRKAVRGPKKSHQILSKHTKKAKPHKIVVKHAKAKKKPKPAVKTRKTILKKAAKTKKTAPLKKKSVPKTIKAKKAPKKKQAIPFKTKLKSRTGAATPISEAKEKFVETSVDQLLHLVERKGKISLGFAARQVGYPRQEVESWAKSLAEHGLIDISYTMFSTYLKKKGGKK